MDTVYIKDIATIAAALEGKVNFSSIEWKERLLSPEYREKSVNDIVFVKKAYGVWFYTSRFALEKAMTLVNSEIPTIVGCANSTNLYLIHR